MNTFVAVVASVLLATVAQLHAATSDLIGRVELSTLAVPGATVTARRGDRVIVTVSDVDGRFRLADLDDGVWTVSVEMLGFVTLTRTVTLPLVAAQPAWTLTMRTLADVAGSTAVTRATTAVRVPVSAAAIEDQPPTEPADGFVINGSVNNGAASPFAQARAFGNNRPQPRSLFTGGLNAALGNSAWNARPFSFGGSGAPSVSYGDVQVGGAIGGPLKIPWLVTNGPQTFFSYQHSVLHNTVSQSALMPTSAQRLGDFSRVIDARGVPVTIRDPVTGVAFPGNVIPADRISPQAVALLRYYPLPNATSTDRGNFQAPVPTRTEQDSVQLRLTKAVNNRNTLTGTMAFQRTAADSTSLFSFTDQSRKSAIDAGVSWTHRFTVRLAMRVRYDFSRSSATVTPFFANRTNVSGEAGIRGNDQDPMSWGPPTLLFPDVAGLGDAQYQRTINRTHGGGVESYFNRGRHNLTMGGDMRRAAVDLSSQQDPRGTFAFTGAATGNAFADFLLGIPSTSSIAFGNPDKRFRAPSYDAYVTDDLRLRSGLTVNLGVRWEYDAPFTEALGRLVNLDVAPNFTAVAPVLATSPTGPVTSAVYPTSLLRPDKLGFEPRLATSWRPVAGSSLVIRAGYGIYRNQGVYLPLALLLAQQPPLSKTFSVQNSALAPLTLADGLSVSPVATSNTFAIDAGFRPGYAHSWQGSLQRELPASLTMIVAYLGSKGSHLTQAFLPNTYPAGGENPCPACPSGFVYLTSNGSSIRHAAQFTLRRRQRNGFTATAQYTLARATDNAATFDRAAITPASLAIAQDWRDLDAERAPSSFDQRHALSVQVQYTSGVGVAGGTLVDGVWGTLLKDWTIASQLSAGSGLPLSPLVFAAVAGTGVVGLRPSVTGAPIASTEPGTYANRAAFADPAPGTWGNAGRNSIRGPAQFALDASLSRVFRLGNRLNLEWRVDATNVLNHVTYAAIGTVISSSQFGLPTLANPMRRIQTLARLRF